MAEQSGISWTDATFNPWIGCTKVGPGCDNCYAEALMDKRWQRVTWGTGRPRLATSERNWKLPLLWEKEHEAFALAHGRRRRVFCASLADVFDNEVDPAWRVELMRLITRTPHLDWMVLTKRIGNAAAMLEAACQGVDGVGWQRNPLANVWLGATVVNQEEADRDIPKLLATPARVRFLSIEPMLGPVNLQYQLHVANTAKGWVKLPWFDSSDGRSAGGGAPKYIGPSVPDVDWVIVGGESGVKARPFHVDWARSIVKQCQAAGVPVHVKQLGAQPRGWCAALAHVAPEDREDVTCDYHEAHEQGQECQGRCAAMVAPAGGDPTEWPEDLRVQQWPALEGPKA